jgi:hypothetical protein
VEESLLANLKELKGQAYRGIIFKWSEDYSLLYDNACAQVHCHQADSFVVHVDFMKRASPQETPTEEWRITPALTSTGEFGRMINGWRKAPDTHPGQRTQSASPSSKLSLNSSSGPAIPPPSSNDDDQNCSL